MWLQMVAAPLIVFRAQFSSSNCGRLRNGNVLPVLLDGETHGGAFSLRTALASHLQQHICYHWTWVVCVCVLSGAPEHKARVIQVLQPSVTLAAALFVSCLMESVNQCSLELKQGLLHWVLQGEKKSTSSSFQYGGIEMSSLGFTAWTFNSHVITYILMHKGLQIDCRIHSSF